MSGNQNNLKSCVTEGLMTRSLAPGLHSLISPTASHDDTLDPNARIYGAFCEGYFTRSADGAFRHNEVTR